MVIRKLFTQALAIAREFGDRELEGWWMGRQGIIYGAIGKLQEAHESYKQALIIAREVSDRLAEGIYVGRLGTLSAASGDQHKALELFAQFIAVCSSSILAEVLSLSSPFSGQSREKRRGSEKRTSLLIDELQPSTNSDQLSGQC